MKKTITCPRCKTSVSVGPQQFPIRCCDYVWNSIDEEPATGGDQMVVSLPIQHAQNNLLQFRGSRFVAGSDGVPGDPHGGLSNQEVQSLFGAEDPSLLGNRLKELFEAVGIPACGGCNKRREWLNKAHNYLREKLGGSPILDGQEKPNAGA